MSEEASWGKLPFDLQEQYYVKAEEEAKAIAERISKNVNEIRKLRHLIQKYAKPFRPSKKLDYVIAAVDGSNTPIPISKLGLGAALYAAGFILFNNKGVYDERYFANILAKRTGAYEESVKRTLYFKMTLIERLAALEALKKAKVVLVDGSFYSFLYAAIRDTKPLSEVDKELVDQISQSTMKLIESNRVIGVIKRSHTRAIGGKVYSEIDHGTETINMLDKYILAQILNTNHLLKYADLFKKAGAFRIYSYVSYLASKDKADPQGILKEAEERVYRPFLDKRMPSSVLESLETYKKLDRMMVKSSNEAPICEFEYPSDAEEVVQGLLEVKNMFNPATGLPIYIDVMDQSVSLPREFGRDFSKEIEAKTLEKIDDQNAVKAFFFPMNPQKEF
ncbi:MAG: DNA double-strand break repair nuclease NurA [Nitrososphaeria archaeon]